MLKKYSSFFLLLITFNSFASDYKLVGSYLLEYSIFKVDVYKISYYKAKEAEKLVLDYKRDVEKKYSIEGWKVGFKDKLSDKALLPKIQWLIENTVDLKKGEKLSLIKTNSHLEILKDDILVAKTSDPMIMAIAFEPWLGEKPVSEDLKIALLGKSGNN